MSYHITDPPLAIGAMAEFPYTDTLYARFWATDKYTEKPFNIAVRKGTKLLVPRELAVLAEGTQDLRTTGTAVEFAASFTAPPARNAEQQRVYENSLALLKGGRSHIIQASTGFGKTWLGARLARALGYKTLVVVTKEDLLGEQQWLGAFQRFAGVPRTQIGLIRQDTYDVEDNTVVLAMIHSLAKVGKYPKSMVDEFGLVIYDECHHVPAETFLRTAGLFNARLRLGLSAGVGRDSMRVDGRDFVFTSHLGPVAVKAQQIATSPKILVMYTPWRLPIVPWKINGSWRHIPMPHEPGKLGAVVVNLAQCQPRNQMIADVVAKAHKQGRHIAVMSELARDKHLDLLAALIHRQGVPEEDIGFYIGGMTEKQRDAAKHKKVLLCTYGMMAEATDIPWLDTCVLATPRSNVKQPIGRILREHPGKKQPIVVDLVDASSAVLESYFRKRCQLYRSTEIDGEIKVIG